MTHPSDGVARPTLILVLGRTAGFAFSFAIPVVLARRFGRAEFGTYKQLFLIYATLYGLAQLGMAESLYYFVPRKPEEAGRHVSNAIVTLALLGASSLALLCVLRTTIATWMANSELVSYLPLLALFLAFTLVSAVFEIVMVSRNEAGKAAGVYAASDLGRTVLLILPALALWRLRGVLIGAACFAALRLLAMLAYLWRQFGPRLRIDMALWRQQMAYALPFASAVGIEVVQANFHQYVVASRFDAATFATYAVGCLQIPMIDLVCTSTANVMMVKMTEETGEGQPRDRFLTLWHDTTCRLASLIFPLAAFLLLAAHGIIVSLFTRTYQASVPIFMVWCLTILPAAFSVDAVLRVYAQTRFLLVMNLLRLAVIAGLIGWFLSTFGLIGAVLITLVGTMVVKMSGLIRIAWIMKVPVREVLPWGRLAGIAFRSGLAALPALWIGRSVSVPPPLAVMCIGVSYGVVFASLWALSVRWKRARVFRLAKRLGIEQGPTCAA